jgi:signal peptidase II
LRFLKEVLEGKGLTKSGQALKLRAGDDFTHLEKLAEKVREKIIYWNSEKKIEVVEFKEED